MGRKSYFSAVFVALLLCGLCVGRAGAATTLYDSEDSLARWQASAGSAALSCSVKAAPGTPDEKALRLKGRYPGRAVFWVQPAQELSDWSNNRNLRFRIYIPVDAPSDISATLFVDDSYLNRYTHPVFAPLEPGRWNTVRVALGAGNRIWKPDGHSKPWDGYCPQEVRRLGIELSSSSSGDLSVFLDKVELAGEADTSSNAIYHLRQNARNVPLYGKFEITFDAKRAYSNPFDPDVVSVKGIFIRPDGTRVEMPGFFHQDYTRRSGRSGSPRATPACTTIMSRCRTDSGSGRPSRRFNARLRGKPQGGAIRGS